jgi:uncharacterized protein YegJ (DUF2314 family)
MPGYRATTPCESCGQTENMKRIPLVLSLVAMMLSACTEQSKTTPVEATDAEMNAAMAEARSTLDRFFDARAAKGEHFEGLLKVYFPMPGTEEGGEHMWVLALDRTEGEISGRLISTPESVALKAGDTVRFPQERVSDWLYVEDGKAVGAVTVRLLRSRMTAEEKKEHDAYYPFAFE